MRVGVTREGGSGARLELAPRLIDLSGKPPKVLRLLEPRLERLWRTMAGDADKMDLMRVSQILTSDFENVPRKSREKIRDHFEFR